MNEQIRILCEMKQNGKKEREKKKKAPSFKLTKLQGKIDISDRVTAPPLNRPFIKSLSYPCPLFLFPINVQCRLERF